MSFRPKQTMNARFIEYTLSADTDVTSGSKILFNTKRTTGGDGVSVSNGVFTLNQNCYYYIVLSIDVRRGTINDSFEINMQDSTSTNLTPANGVSKIDWNDSDLVFSNNSLIAALKYPASTYSFVYTSQNTGRINTPMDVLIMEFYK